MQDGCGTGDSDVYGRDQERLGEIDIVYKYKKEDGSEIKRKETPLRLGKMEGTEKERNMQEF